MRNTFLIAIGSSLGLIRSSWALDSKPVVDALQKWDAAFSINQFNSKEFQNERYVTDLSSTTAGGKYRIQTTISSQAGKSSPFSLLFDGQDETTTIGDYVTISRVTSKDDSEVNRAVSLQPGPCYFKGRGLSMFHDVQVEAIPNSSLVSFEGQTPNGEHIKAILDPFQKYLARRIERLHEGKPFVVIETQGSLCGGLMPRSSTVKMIAPLQGPTQRFEFLSARFAHKPLDTFQFVANRPLMIADARSGSPLVIKKTSSKPMTKADILALTNKEAARLNALKNQEHSLENNQRYLNWALTIGPLVGAILLLAWRSKKHV